MTEFAPEFREWPKTKRLFRDIVVTEKIDGTNAALHISEDGQVVAQSRNRLITPDGDNYGFARWAEEHAFDLGFVLGPGLHYGEWWGQGIQRRYGMSSKKFSVFNTARWAMPDDSGLAMMDRARGSKMGEQLDAVPVLYEGTFSEAAITQALSDLRTHGSFAAPGFMNPEGICVYHTQTRNVFKVTLDNQDAGKWEVTA